MQGQSVDFLGHEAVLASLHEALSSYGAAALIGPDGSGKTQTALQYAHQYQMPLTWIHTLPLSLDPIEGVVVVPTHGVLWPEAPSDNRLLVLSDDAPADLPYPVLRLEPLSDEYIAGRLAAAGLDADLAPWLGGSPLALHLLITSGGAANLTTDGEPLSSLLAWHWHHLDETACYLWQLSAAFRDEALVPIARLRWLAGWEEGVFQAALDTLQQAGVVRVIEGGVDVHARLHLTEIGQASALRTAAQRLVAAYRQPDILQAQLDERGSDAVRHDLDALAHCLPDVDALHRLRRLLVTDSPTVVLHLRERAHHQGDHDLRAACDSWLADQAHFYTEAVWHYPMEASHALIGHSQRVTDVLAVDGRHLLTTAHDGTLRLWDADSGQVRRVLVGHQGGVACAVMLTPYHAVSGGVDTTLRVWDLRTGDLLRTLSGHEWPITALTCLDDDRIISASADNTLRLWDIAAGETLRVFEGHSEPVATVALWDKHHLLSGSYDGTARLWDIRSGKTLRTFKGHSASVTAVAWTPDGQVVTGSSDKTIRLWNVETSAIVREFGNHVWPIQALVVWGDHYLISAADTIRVWDMANGVLVRRLDGHSRPVTALAACDERYLVSGSADTTVRLWDLRDSGPPPTPAPHRDWVTAVVGLQYPYAASAGTDNQLQLWNLEQGSLVQSIQAHDDGIHALVNLGGGNLVTASADHTLQVWHWALDENGPILRGHQDEVTTAAVLKTQWLISGSADQTLRVWDCWAGECLQVLSGHPARITALTVLNEQRVIVGDALGNIWLWDLARAEVLQRYSGYPDAVSDLAVVRDTLWAAGHHPTIHSWHLSSGRAEQTLVGHEGWVTALSALDKPNMLVSASFDGTLRLWDTRQAQQVTLLNLDTPILSLDHLVRGRLLIGDASGKVRVMGTYLPD